MISDDDYGTPKVEENFGIAKEDQLQQSKDITIEPPVIKVESPNRARV